VHRPYLLQPVRPEAAARDLGVVGFIRKHLGKPVASTASLAARWTLSVNLKRRGGLGLASGHDGWWITCRSRIFETKDLLAAAKDLHRAIRAAVDPEAFSDIRGGRPYVELRDPAQILRPWRPGASIQAWQAAAMAEIQSRLTGS